MLYKKTSFQIFPRSIKLLIFFAGLITFLLVILKGVVSSSSYDIALSNFKKSLIFLRQLLSSPLFICFIINFIVIIIAASYAIENNHVQENHEILVSSSTSIDYHDHDFQIVLPPPPTPPSPTHTQEPNTMKKEEATLTDASFSFKNHMGSPQNHQDEILSYQNSFTEGIEKAQKPIESETIKKAQINSKEVEQKVLEKERISELEITNTGETDNDTMEATWRAITERGAKTENKTLKKIDTWAQPLETDSKGLMPKSVSATKMLRKSSMSFNETISMKFRGGMMRGPSISLEELHERVEAHIKNFNMEMRLQRQESEQRYLEMLNRNI